VKSEKPLDYPTMEGPAIYRIRVRGRLNTDLSDRLEGMHILNLQRNDGTAESLLEGSVLDQAALAGVLNQLFELHLPVMAVDCLGGPNND